MGLNATGDPFSPFAFNESDNNLNRKYIKICKLWLYKMNISFYLALNIVSEILQFI